VHCGSLFRYGPTVAYPIQEGGGPRPIRARVGPPR
jgi:hypothetical protein